MRQYIGARYVPKFEGDWANNRTYEALSVVSYMGDSYTSKKPVPVNVLPTNTDYWALTGAYNSQIAELSEKVSRLTNRRYVFIGDSYNTTDTPPGGVPIVPWSTDLVSYLGIAAGDYYTIGNSGSGFVHGTPFITLLNTITASVSDRDSITDVVVLGGINDNTESLSDLNTALDAFIARATDLYPNAMITIGFISWTRDNAIKDKLVQIMLYYEEKRKYPNVRIITNAFKFYHYYSAMYQSDGHPNATGSSAIAGGIANYLKNGGTDTHWSIAQSNITFDAGLGITQGTMSIKFNQNNDEITTNLICDNYLRSSGFNLNTGQDITIGTFNYSLADFMKISPIMGHMYVYDTNNKFYNVSFKLTFEHNTITMTPLEVGGDAVGTFAINGITLMQLNFPGFFVTPIEFC